MRPALSSLPRVFAAAGNHRFAVLAALWPSVVGDGLAAHSEAAGLQGEVLRIRVDSASWLKTLRDLRGTLILRLQAAAGELAPRALAFVQGSVTRRATTNRARPSRTPLDPDQLPEAVRRAADGLPTPEARELYLRAALSYRTRFPERAVSKD